MSVTKWMVRVRWLATFPHAEQHQPTVPGVNYGMNRLREHGGAAGKRGCDKLRDRDRHVTGDRRIDSKFGFRNSSRAWPHRNMFVFASLIISSPRPLSTARAM